MSEETKDPYEEIIKEASSEANSIEYCKKLREKGIPEEIIKTACAKYNYKYENNFRNPKDNELTRADK